MSIFEHAIVWLIPLCIIVGAYFWACRDVKKYYSLIVITVMATWVLIVLGAYVRLSDAGLGCPDWPGCYGNLTPQHSTAEILAAEAVQPGGPVSMAKAWKEMLHRYLAMVVGALIAAIMFVAWRNRRRWEQSVILPTITSLAVIFQALLGAWTVTLLLKPAIVTSHLLGGVTIFSLLVWQLSRQPRAGKWADGIMASGGVRALALFALLVLFAQITVGGWVSTNYAALACGDLPTCHGAWVPNMDFVNAFHVIRPLGIGPDGAILTLDALTAIHWVHRVGALIVVFVVGGFAWRLFAVERARMAVAALLVLLLLQVLLGLSNVWFSLPLPVAVAHNGIAAILFACLLVINLRLAK